MASHINHIIIQGNLVRDPEVKEFTSSKVCKFTIASNYTFKDVKEVCFTEVTAWGLLADHVMATLTKGSPCIVEGRLKEESWVSRDNGKKMSKFVIVATEVIDLPRNPKVIDNPDQYEAEEPSF
jgi:single-strand DNA-binding protein